MTGVRSEATPMITTISDQLVHSIVNIYLFHLIKKFMVQSIVKRVFEDQGRVRLVWNASRLDKQDLLLLMP